MGQGRGLSGHAGAGIFPHAPYFRISTMVPPGAPLRVTLKPKSTNMNSLPFLRLHAALLAVVSVIVFLPTRANADSAAEISSSARAGLRRLLAQSPVAREVEKHSSAVLVFPKITKGGFLIGAQHGEGALLLRNGHFVYFNTVAASYGLQAGIQQFGYALFFINGRAMEHLYSQGGWEIGSAPSLVIVNKGTASSLSTTSLRKDIYVFFFDQKGLMGGMGLQGSKITRIHPR
jgi:lipid-binding SYLF domain-containing protein